MSDAKTQLTIRRFDPARDTPSLRACVIDHQNFHRAIEPSWPDGAAVADDYLAHLDRVCAEQNGGIFLAEIAEQTAGFICVVATTRGESPDDPTPFAWLYDLYVKPDYRRQGVASRLMTTAEHFARDEGAQWIRLGVLDRNEDARAFYAGHGFHEYTHVLRKRLA